MASDPYQNNMDPKHCQYFNCSQTKWRISRYFFLETMGHIIQRCKVTCMNFLQTGLTSLLRVAENIMTCFSWGVDRKISCIVGIENIFRNRIFQSESTWTSRLMSSSASILSHSSRTKCFKFFRFNFFPRIRAE